MITQTAQPSNQQVASLFGSGGGQTPPPNSSAPAVSSQSSSSASASVTGNAGQSTGTGSSPVAQAPYVPSGHPGMVLRDQPRQEDSASHAILPEVSPIPPQSESAQTAEVANVAAPVLPTLNTPVADSLQSENHWASMQAFASAEPVPPVAPVAPAAPVTPVAQAPQVSETPQSPPEPVQTAYPQESVPVTPAETAVTETDTSVPGSQSFAPPAAPLSPESGNHPVSQIPVAPIAVASIPSYVPDVQEVAATPVSAPTVSPIEAVPAATPSQDMGAVGAAAYAMPQPIPAGGVSDMPQEAPVAVTADAMSATVPPASGGTQKPSSSAVAISLAAFLIGAIAVIFGYAVYNNQKLSDAQVQNANQESTRGQEQLSNLSGQKPEVLSESTQKSPQPAPPPVPKPQQPEKPAEPVKAPEPEWESSFTAAEVSDGQKKFADSTTSVSFTTPSSWKPCAFLSVLSIKMGTGWYDGVCPSSDSTQANMPTQNIKNMQLAVVYADESLEDIASENDSFTFTSETSDSETFDEYTVTEKDSARTFRVYAAETAENGYVYVIVPQSIARDSLSDVLTSFDL